MARAVRRAAVSHRHRVILCNTLIEAATSVSCTKQQATLRTHAYIACRAMFADIGHFSRPAIQLGFCVVVVSLLACPLA